MKKFFIIALAAVGLVSSVHAEDRTTRVNVSSGLLYERGWDATVSVERETRYHNVWEYFGNVYLKWEDCPSCQHICPESFWKSYNTWNLGVAYKPSVYRSRNTTGRLRLGASLGSDTHDVIGGIHVGYEHDYRLNNGMTLFWRVKTDAVINGKDLFRTGAEIGFKLPVN